MDFDLSPKIERLKAQLVSFMDREVYPAEAVFERQLNEAPSRWQIPPVMEELKEKAKAEGLWNLFLPESELGAGLSNLEYAPLCEIMGRSPIAPEARRRYARRSRAWRVPRASARRSSGCASICGPTSRAWRTSISRPTSP